jgi:hypothetical protein
MSARGFKSIAQDVGCPVRYGRRIQPSTRSLRIQVQMLMHSRGRLRGTPNHDAAEDCFSPIWPPGIGSYATG